MHVASTSASEIRITLEVLVELANRLRRRAADPTPVSADGVRQVLAEAGFTRATSAPAAALDRLTDRLVGLAALVEPFPDLATVAAAVMVNEQLTELPVAPAVVEHDGVGPHIHWTPSTARFDDQVVTDMLMALAQELCDHGTGRFGRCAATGCDQLFFDATRNNSRRFCGDPRCASRTHTADHRARRGRPPA
ncbi:MAG: CGNR zinc finger domain-containing protein [Acidimicrobiales bacterium]